MKSIRFRHALKWLTATAALLVFPLAHAQWAYNDAYWHRGPWAAEKAQSSWMQTVQDSTPLWQLSIPGTHDSASTGYGGDAVQTQSLTISQQLTAGIRYLDFRCRLFDGSLQLHHGVVWLHKSCASGVADVAAFLRKHPSETVLIKVQQEHSSASDAEYQREFDKMVEPFSNVVWQGAGATKTPTLGQVRGKIVFIQRFNQWTRNVLSYNRFYHLDNYQMGTNWDLHSHWEAVKSQLSAFAQGREMEEWITHLVGSGGSFPYFVAGGRSSPNGGHLLTGLTTPGWSGSYPDFPRDDCFIGICSIFFKGLNELTAEYIEKHKPAYVGIIVADFPGPLLIDAIIKRNARTWKYNDTASAGEVFVYDNPYTHTVDYFAARSTGSYWYFPAACRAQPLRLRRPRGTRRSATCMNTGIPIAIRSTTSRRAGPATTPARGTGSRRTRRPMRTGITWVRRY